MKGKDREGDTMSQPRGPTLALRARGPLACFTRPELKVERVSYQVMTPSAARGLLEAVLWKPAIRWHVERVKVLSPIRFVAFRRNEVNSKAKISSKQQRTPSTDARFLIEDHRVQRNTVALSDVDYIVEAHFTLTDQAGDKDNLTKFTEMFTRRLTKGQCFHRPYLGCREFAAEVLPAKDAPPPVADTRELGLMLWDIQFRKKGNTPLFFKARLEQGVLEVPARPDYG